ncbi:Skp family chaperone for outer membrane proteins [Erythromicrobium ramosum]|uniref:OmpH family outer membrane protein n=1 Tax=Erythrobacter ramosus TaxID=35811 RepID=A0A6I4UI15_9SPHN|nr:OmpH family outer membrane protein [Erythrobacter ramosus]MBB3776397.1 Skp family chaperone for outer membrane proteins [Erythrobacter ramosus]MXP38522.1 OmpH family outer membrane protein [Erythrobacter ramosus]
MTRLAKLLAPAGLVLAATAALPAQAQVDGRMASVDVTRTIIGTTAFQTSYEQVNTTYAQQNELRRTKALERQTMLAKFDKNADKQVDETEQAAMQKSADFPKLQALEQEIQGLSNQIDGARVFAIEQIIMQYGSALQDVTTAEQIKVVLDPGTVLFAVPEMDITPKVTAALNARVPAVGVVPPAGWQPSREGVQVYQEIQQRLAMAAQMQQQQAAPAPQGDTAAPVGR